MSRVCCRVGRSPQAAAAVWVAIEVSLAAWGGGCSRAPPDASERAANPGATTPTAQEPRAEAPAVTAATKGMREQLLAGVVAVLSELERYDEVRGAEQVFDRLVQWNHAAPAPEWQPDPLLATLPADLRAAGVGVLERPTFDGVGDIQAIRDRVWLADIARTARGGGVDDLEAATRLFQWTIRWLAAVSDPPMVPSTAVPGARWFYPGEILLAGRGSPAQRAWIFLELLRQAGIDGVMLATPGRGGGPPRPWVPAAIIDGEAYLFEPAYGMPIPGPLGAGVATARQAAADPAVLAAMSLPDRPYPIQAGDLDGMVVLVAADAWSLSPRMVRLAAELGPTQRVEVAVAASGLAAKARAALPGERSQEPGLWLFPWETLARRSQATASLADELGPLTVPLPSGDPRNPDQTFRPLFAGRVREFRGDLDGPAGAKAAYLAARPSRRAIAAAVAGLPEPQAAAVTRGLVRMKEDATYWLGLVTLSEGQFEAAVDYLERMTLSASPDSRWTDAAHVNLAAALTELGRDGEAAAALEADGSPQRFGSRLLARRLRTLPGPEPEAAPDAQPEQPAERASEPVL
jgi:hypothetical protein